MVCVLQFFQGLFQNDVAWYKPAYHFVHHISLESFHDSAQSIACYKSLTAGSGYLQRHTWRSGYRVHVRAQGIGDTRIEVQAFVHPVVGVCSRQTL